MSYTLEEDRHIDFWCDVRIVRMRDDETVDISSLDEISPMLIAISRLCQLI